MDYSIKPYRNKQTFFQKRLKTLKLVDLFPTNNLYPKTYGLKWYALG